MNTFKNILRRNLVSFFGQSKAKLIIEQKHKFTRYIFKCRKIFIFYFFLIVGFKQIVFQRYGLINLNEKFPAILFDGFNGITYIGKEKYISKRVILKNYTQHLEYQSLKQIAELNDGYIPVSIFESNYVQFSDYEVVGMKKSINFNDLDREFSLKILVGDNSLPMVQVPFIEGFFHFYIELVPTILQRLTSNCFLLRIPRDSFYLVILDYFNLDYIKIFDSDQRYFDSSLMLVKKGLYPTKNDLLVLRDYLSLNLNCKSSTSHKIYITRRNNKNGRRIKDEEFIIDLLTINGFIVVDPDEIVFQEQIELMQSASIVISAHGAALSHLVCVPKECKVIELNGDIDVRWHYYKIAQLLELDYMLLIGSTCNEAEFSVDVERIRTAISMLLE